MCFSATVSFGASAVIAATGIQAYNHAKTPELKSFAMVPIFFAAQQFTEGWIWISLQNPDLQFSNNFIPFMTVIFLIFAWIIWPIYIPYFSYRMESDPIKKRYLKFILGIGIAVSLIMVYILFSQDIMARIEDRHIVFNRAGTVPFLMVLGSVYFITLIFPLFISSYRKLRILGFVSIFSFLFTKIMFDNYFISVWCFFAAISSLYVLYIIMDIQHEKIAIPNWRNMLSH